MYLPSATSMPTAVVISLACHHIFASHIDVVSAISLLPASTVPAASLLQYPIIATHDAAPSLYSQVAGGLELFTPTKLPRDHADMFSFREADTTESLLHK